MKQLFAIFLIFQLWATPAYAALSECAEQLGAHVMASIDLDGMADANHLMSQSDVTLQSEAACAHCEDNLVFADQTSRLFPADELCAGVEVDADYGLTSKRDQIAILPLVKVTGSERFQPDVGRIQHIDPSVGHNRIYLRTLRIRI